MSTLISTISSNSCLVYLRQKYSGKKILLGWFRTRAYETEYAGLSKIFTWTPYSSILLCPIENIQTFLLIS